MQNDKIKVSICVPIYGAERFIAETARSLFAQSYDNIEYIFHTHAKFYNVHEDFKETAVALPEVIEAFKKAGYHGFLSSEYEGGEHLRDVGVDSITQVAWHQEAMRRLIEA